MKKLMYICAKSAKNGLLYVIFLLVVSITIQYQHLKSKKSCEKEVVSEKQKDEVSVQNATAKKDSLNVKNQVVKSM